MRPRALLAAALLLALCGCLSGTWRRDSEGSPVTESTVEAFVLGEAGLQTVLDRLGAPIEVWEHSHHGVAVAYGWYESEGFEMKVQTVKVLGPNQEEAIDVVVSGQASLRQAVVFTFDECWMLSGWRRGLLEDLLAERDARPNVPPR